MDRLGFFKQGLSSLLEAAQTAIGLKHAADSFTEAVDEALSDIKGEMGLHLLSIDADIYDQPENTLAELSRMGYTSLETGLYYGGKVHGMSATAFKSLADKAGLKITSAHLNHLYEVPQGAQDAQGAKEEEAQQGEEQKMGAKKEGVQEGAEPKASPEANPDPNDEWWSRALDTHRKLGCRYVVMSRLPDYPTDEDIATYVTYFNRIGALAAERGMQFCYHPDAAALRTTPRTAEAAKGHKEAAKQSQGAAQQGNGNGGENGTPEVVEKKKIFEVIAEGCDPERVCFQIDTYEAAEANIDVIELLKQHGKRIALLHLHDYGSVGDSGRIDFDKIVKQSIGAGVKEIFVEVRSYSLPPLNCVERSIHNLSSMPSVRY